MGLLLKNIKELVQVRGNPVGFVSGKEMAILPTLKNAFLLIKGNLIEDYGLMENLLVPSVKDGIVEINCSGRMVFPAYCDSHTHIVFPSARVGEFIDRIKGLSYEEIAQRGGGILNSAKLLHETPEEDLFILAKNRLGKLIGFGTGAIEIKSGYGLNTRDELKMLRVIKRLKESSSATIKSTFLGAHSVPGEFQGNQSGYVDSILNEMIPQIAEEGLADFIDVFCDKGFFTPVETDLILEAGQKYGLRGKIHANELGFSGGIKVAVKHQALSVDHLEYINDEEIACLKGSETMPTILPGAAFFLGLPLSPARKMIDAGLPIALASDFNPGSSPSGNMNFITSLGCIRYKMLPEEVFNAVTLNSAYAMGLEKQLGSITRGKVANVFITSEDIEGYASIPYYFGSNLVETVILNGKIQNL
jgi:imidazolonepropionase